MKNIFQRSQLNPILKPDKRIKNESRKDYNAGAIFEEGKYFLYYRAVGETGVSRIKLAVSTDGENFEKKNLVVLEPDRHIESRGVEDPRLQKVGDRYIMTYTAYDGKTARLCSALSKDLLGFDKQDEMLDDWNAERAGYFSVPWDKAQQNPVAKIHWSKAGGVFPSKYDNKYLMLFGDRDIRFAVSDSMFEWRADQEPFIKERIGHFDSVHVEMGPPPIKTEQGWLVLYHGISAKAIYRLGYLLLDLHNPRRIIKRSEEAIFEPSLDYEQNGDLDIEENDEIKPQVIFCNGAVLRGDELRIYYGAGDSTLCTAVARLEDVLAFE